MRLGTTATIVDEFDAERGYFGAEFGNAADGPGPRVCRPRLGRPRQRCFAAIRTASSARARSFRSATCSRRAKTTTALRSAAAVAGRHFSRRRLAEQDSRQRQRQRAGSAARRTHAADERSRDAADRRALSRRLSRRSRPTAPTSTRARLQHQQPAEINNDSRARPTRPAPERPRPAVLSLHLTSQNVDAFQFVAGQNPDTDIKIAPRAHHLEPHLVAHDDRGFFDRASTVWDRCCCRRRMPSALVNLSGADDPRAFAGHPDRPRAEPLSLRGDGAPHARDGHFLTAGSRWRGGNSTARRPTAHRGIFRSATTSATTRSRTCAWGCRPN